MRLVFAMGTDKLRPTKYKRRTRMAKGYWIAHVRVRNPDRYKDYVAANAVAFKKYNARFIIRGGKFEVRGGAGPSRDRHVVIEFESYDVARACYDSPEYKAAAAIRDEAADADIVIVEGYDG
jgi:uncharacterized protein (DUF1330 family)